MTEQEIIQEEARFWDRQEDVIQKLYDRPHDWRFAPKLARCIIRGRERFLRGLLQRHRHEIHRVLDIGCGSGWFVHACAELGIAGFGIDVAGKKIARAREEATERGLDELCTFHVGDIMELDAETAGGKVDMLFAQSSLHHLPGLEEKLPIIVDRLLRPGGFMLFCEPHHDDGMAPRLERFIWGLGRSKLFGRLFDVEFFNEVSQAAQGEAPESEASLRGESPAGKMFFGEEPDMRELMHNTGYELLAERFYHSFAGHLTNAFYIFMKSKVVRGMYRVSLPIVAGMDNFLCRFGRFQKYAEEGVWLLRAPTE